MTLTKVPAVVEIDPPELQRRLQAGEFLEFFDVRTESERELATLGARLLDPSTVAYIEALSKDTPLVFH